MLPTIQNYQPYGLEMYKHQRETMLFILTHKRCFVFDSIGTGKTLASLSACDLLMLHGKINRVLIIAPLSVLRATWCDHILRYFPGRSFTILHGTKSQRIANIKMDCDFYVINTDGIKILEEEIIRRDFDMVIVDESTTFASHSSARTKCAWRICKIIKSVVCMSGSPIANDTLQSYAQAKLVDFGRPRWFTKYRDQLKTKIDMYTYRDKPEAVDIAYATMQPAIRHDKKDCLDLPPVTFETIDVKLSTEQEKHYKIMDKEYITFLESGESITAANAAVRYTKLLQISCGLIINNDGEAIDINQKSRIKELKLIIDQTDSIIIFANFTKSINSLVEDIPGSRKIDGSVSGNKRGTIIADFQDKKFKVLICQPQAISHGVTLTAAHDIVWFSPTFSNETFQQCNGRIDRPGQKHKMTIFLFQATKAEKRVYAALKRKEKVSQAMLNYEVEV